MRGEGRDGARVGWGEANARHAELVAQTVEAIRRTGREAVATPEGQGTPVVVIDGAEYLAPDVWVRGAWGVVAVEVKAKRRLFRTSGTGRWHLGCDDWAWGEYCDLELRRRVPLIHLWSPGDIDDEGSVVVSQMRGLVPAIRGAYGTQSGTTERYVAFTVLDREGLGTVGTWKRHQSPAAVPWSVLIDEADDIDYRLRLSREAARPDGYRIERDWTRRVDVRYLFERWTLHHT